MPLIIAIVLIVIIGVMITNEKGKLNQYNSESEQRNAEHNLWASRYVDRELETELKRFIASEKNENVVFNEVFQALRGLEHWKTKTNLNLHYVLKASRTMSGKARMELVARDRELALNIMLANRGKVSSLSTSFGYQAYLNSDSEILKCQQFELVEWIKNTLNQQGGDVELVYSGVGDSKVPADCYYWAGTRNALPFVGEKAPQRFKPFSKDLINKR